MFLNLLGNIFASREASIITNVSATFPRLRPWLRPWLRACSHDPAYRDILLTDELAARYTCPCK
jgi:hypothetical protein